MTAALLLALAGGVVGGVLGHLLRLPGGAILGGLLGAGCVQLLTGNALTLPNEVRLVAQIGIGGAIGARMAPGVLRRLGPVLVFALPLLLLFVTAALALGVLYAALGGLPTAIGMLATAPGGVPEVLTVALELGEGAGVVAAVHVGRQLLVLVAVGGLLRWVLARAPQHPAAAPEGGASRAVPARGAAAHPPARPGILWTPSVVDASIGLVWDQEQACWALPTALAEPGERWRQAASREAGRLGLRVEGDSYLGFDLPALDDRSGPDSPAGGRPAPRRAWALRVHGGARRAREVTWCSSSRAFELLGGRDRVALEAYLSIIESDG